MSCSVSRAKHKACSTRGQLFLPEETELSVLVERLSFPGKEGKQPSVSSHCLKEREQVNSLAGEEISWPEEWLLSFCSLCMSTKEGLRFALAFNTSLRSSTTKCAHIMHKGLQEGRSGSPACHRLLWNTAAPSGYSLSLRNITGLVQMILPWVCSCTERSWALPELRILSEFYRQYSG